MSRDLKIVDFHSHILPCVDHGSDGIKTSEYQVALMNTAGVDTVVLTPHFYPNLNRVSVFKKEVSAAAEELISRCETRPRFCLGAEVLYCNGIEDMENIDKLCIEGTNILLLELPISAEWNKAMIYAIKRMSVSYTIVLAHIDRYVGLHDRELISLLSEDNVWGQINASSLLRGKARRALSPYLKAGYVCAIGSDIHGKSKKCYRKFKKVRKALGEDNYSIIMTRSSELLEGAILY